MHTKTNTAAAVPAVTLALAVSMLMFSYFLGAWDAETIRTANPGKSPAKLLTEALSRTLASAGLLTPDSMVGVEMRTTNGYAAEGTVRTAGGTVYAIGFKGDSKGFREVWASGEDTTVPEGTAEAIREAVDGAIVAAFRECGVGG